MDFALTEEHRQVQKMVRDFAAKEVIPSVGEWDRKQEFNPNYLTRMGELGLLGISIPVRYGGQGFDYISLGLVCEELERADTHLRVVMSVHHGLNSQAVLQWGNEDQKQRFLVPQARGEKYAAFGLTEPNAGSDVAAMLSTARKVGDKYILNGEKMWISLASRAHHFLVIAKTDPSKGHEGMSAFLVTRDMPGVTTGDIHGKLGVRAGSTGWIKMEEVEVPVENRLGEEGEGFKIAMSCLDNGRFTVATGAVGLIRACLEESIKYAHERSTFGNPIGKHQLIKQKIALMQQWYDAAFLLCAKVGVRQGRLDEERGHPQHPRDRPRQVVRHRPQRAGRAGSRPTARRIRLQRRVPGRALPAQQQGRGDLRRHERDSPDYAGRLRAGLPQGQAAALRDACL